MTVRDPTGQFSLGTILTKLKVVTRDEVEEMLRIQGELSDDERLGELLVARGRLSREQLELALAAQRDLRSTDNCTRALAAARLADLSTSKIVAFSRELRESAISVRRESDHVGWPAVAPAVEKS